MAAAAVAEEAAEICAKTNFLQLPKTSYASDQKINKNELRQYKTCQQLRDNNDARVWLWQFEKVTQT